MERNAFESMAVPVCYMSREPAWSERGSFGV